MTEKAKVLNPDGTEGSTTIPDKVDKSSVDQAIKMMGPLLKEYGVAQGEAIADRMEESLEKLAKRLENNEPINEDVMLEKAARNAPRYGEVAGELIDDKARKTFVKNYFATMAEAGRENNVEKAATVARERGYHYVQKALSASDYGSAGVLIPDEVFNGLKEIKDDAVVIRQVAGRTLVLRHGATSIPKELVNATATYADESEDLTLTEFEMGEERIEPKKLTVLIVGTNELMKDGVNVGEVIQSQMRRAYALKENATLIRGAGSPKQPMGLRYQTHADNIFARTQAGASSTVQEIRADLIDAMIKPQLNNLDGRGAWMFPAAIKGGLMKVLTTDMTLAPFASEVAAGSLFGAPIFVTNAIPDNLGAGDEGEVYYVLRDELMIVDSQDLTLDTSRDASYKLANGNYASAFSRDEFVMRLIGRSTIHLMYPKAASVITTVDWNNL